MRYNGLKTEKGSSLAEKRLETQPAQIDRVAGKFEGEGREERPLGTT